MYIFGTVIHGRHNDVQITTSVYGSSGRYRGVGYVVCRAFSTGGVVCDSSGSEAKTASCCKQSADPLSVNFATTNEHRPKASNPIIDKCARGNSKIEINPNVLQNP